MNAKTTTRALLLALIAAVALFFAPAAFAQHGDEHGEHGADEHAEGDAHADDAHGDAHGEGAHGDEHGGEHAGHHTPEPEWNALGAGIINFFIFLGLLVYFGRKPIANFYAVRRASVADGIKRSQALHEQAEAKLAEFEKKMESFEAEKQQILDDYRKLGEAERERIVRDAQDAASKIKKEAKLLIDQEVRGAKARLEAQLIDSAIGKARTAVSEQLTPARQQKMLDSYIAELGDAQAH